MAEYTGEGAATQAPTSSAPGPDVPYPATFIDGLAPAALDLVVRVAGRRPPGHARGFTWCELGCGRGLSAVLLAGLHPQGEFHGVDAMPVHIADGRALGAQAGLANLHLHAVDFGGALSLELPQFDYIVAHGVYSWIDDRSRAQMLQFIDRRLKPGGLVYVSYNNMVGWAADAPYQYLVRHLAEGQAGDSAVRCLAAMAQVAGLAAAGVAALQATPIVKFLESHRDRFQTNYFPHEYLAAAWRPAYVTEVRGALASFGLEPVGSAMMVDNFDRFVLRASEREAVARFADPDRRELVRDYCLASRFRRDVFGRGLAPLDKAAQAEALMATRFDVARPPSQIDYRMTTPAAEIRFDTPAVRTIVAALVEGPRTLASIAAPGVSPADLLAAALTLTAAEAIRPVADQDADVSRLNEALLARLEGPEPIRYLALRTGAALKAEIDDLHALRSRFTPPETGEWRAFLQARGLG